MERAGPVLADDFQDYGNLDSLLIYPVNAGTRWLDYTEVIRTSNELASYELSIVPRGSDDQYQAFSEVSKPGNGCIEVPV